MLRRIFSFRSVEERFDCKGTQEALDIPPGSHLFSCDGRCRVILLEEGNKIRTTFVLEKGSRRLIIPGDVLVTVQCAEDVTWMFGTAQAAEIVDPTRRVVPIDQGSNKAHTDLRYMIDRMMRGGVMIKRPVSEEETDADRNDFGQQSDHPFSRYEQLAYDEDNPKPKDEKPPVVEEPPKAI